MAAVQQDGFALQFVKEQTEEICLAAIWYGINIYIAAVNQNIDSVKYIDKKLEHII